MKNIIAALVLISFPTFYESTTIDCQYGTTGYWAAGTIYECKFKYYTNLNSSDNAQIEAVRGTHSGGQTNNDEIYIQAFKNVVNYFPKGLEKIFPNLVGFYLSQTFLRGIKQSDLKSYTKLTYLNLYDQNIQFIENNLFDFNPNMKHVRFDSCKIVHIGLNTFDNLSNLLSLYLGYNTCINDRSHQNDKAGVLRVINLVKSQCQNSVFLNIDKKMKKIIENSKSLSSENFDNFKENVTSFESELKEKRFSNNIVLNQKIETVKKFLDPLTYSLDNKAMLQNLSNSVNSLNSLIYKNDQTNKLRHVQYETLSDLQLQNTEMLKNLSASVTSLNSMIHKIDQTKMNSRLMLFMTCVISLIQIIVIILIIKCYS